MVANCIMMPPGDFIQKQNRWLQAISKYKATYSGAPNFAYDLCVKKTKTKQLESLDLRSWKVAFNGSEPVRFATIEQFSSKFSSAEFNKIGRASCRERVKRLVVAVSCGKKTR